MYLYFESIFIEFCSKGSHRQEFNLQNWQVIALNNGELAYWRI